MSVGNIPHAIWPARIPTGTQIRGSFTFTETIFEIYGGLANKDVPHQNVQKE